MKRCNNAETQHFRTNEIPMNSNKGANDNSNLRI